MCNVFFPPLTKSENARLALCEHPQWTPVVVMLGLLQCSVPPVLKAEVLKCLAAFGKSPEIAASLWQSLEYTQVSLYRVLETALIEFFFSKFMIKNNRFSFKYKILNITNLTI